MTRLIVLGVVLCMASVCSAQYKTTVDYQSSSQTACAVCGQVHSYVGGNYQSQAQWEVREMASRGHKGHIRGTISGVRFCGVGWSSHSSNAPTCTPSSAMTLVADAVAKGRDGWYRVRYWR